MKPKPKDTTRNERQSRRQSALDKIAQAAGYDTWRKLETAALKGKVKVCQRHIQDPITKSWDTPEEDKAWEYLNKPIE